MLEGVRQNHPQEESRCIVFSQPLHPRHAMWSLLLAGHQATTYPLVTVCGLPTNCGWGRSSFYIRCWPVHTKSSASDPIASFLLVPTAGQAGLRSPRCRAVAGGKEGLGWSPRPTPGSPLVHGHSGEAPCDPGSRRGLRPLFQADAPWSQATKGGMFRDLLGPGGSHPSSSLAASRRQLRLRPGSREEGDLQLSLSDSPRRSRSQPRVGVAS